MKINLTKASIDLLQPKSTRYQVWDQQVRHFGIRVSPSGNKSFILKYVNHNREQKYKTIGKYGAWTLKKARDEAIRLNGQISIGRDPQLMKMEKAREISVSMLCDRYLKDGCGHKKPSTLATDRGRINRLIKPLLGQKKIGGVTKRDVERFQERVTAGDIPGNQNKKNSNKKMFGGRGTASRTMGLLGAIFQYAVDSELMVRNPVRGVKRSADEKNEKYLTQEELSLVSLALHRAEKQHRNIFAIQAIRLLMQTGCRAGEILNLKWHDVHLDDAYFDVVDGKTGFRTCKLSVQTVSEFKKIPKIADCDLVFPGSNLDKPYQGLGKFWRKLLKDAGVDHARLHDLRHTYASIAISEGIPLAVVGCLLGHRDPSTTQRYAHILDNTQEEAVEQVSGKISEFINI
ncbi:MAG: site-specific integrase [Cohaesibacter sp.]|jgi:integrase|nr:site-specific integrase [Cohaesibacter sp.]